MTTDNRDRWGWGQGQLLMSKGHDDDDDEDNDEDDEEEDENYNKDGCWQGLLWWWGHDDEKEEEEKEKHYLCYNFYSKMIVLSSFNNKMPAQWCTNIGHSIALSRLENEVSQTPYSM